MADVPTARSGPTTRKVQDGARHPRLARELKTIRAMARIFCRKHHGRASDGLCVECEALLNYAIRRLDRCVFGDDKPTCVNCTNTPSSTFTAGSSVTVSVPAGGFVDVWWKYTQ